MKRNLTIIAILIAVAGVLVWLAATPSHAATSTLTGTIVDAQGNPLNGRLTMQLPAQAQDTATNTAVMNTLVTYKVVNGVIQSGPPLYDVAGLQPTNLYYIAKVYDAAGNLVMDGNYVVTGASFNLGAATPTSITTSNISFVNPVNPAVPNNFTARQSFQAIASLSTPVAATGFINMANTDNLCWRNSNNTGDLCLNVGLFGSSIGNFAVSSTTTSPSTNFGVAISTTTLVSAVNVTGFVFVNLQAIVSQVGVGCSAASNTVTPTINWTAPAGTAASASLGSLSFTGNGTLDAGAINFQAPQAFVTKSAAITYSTVSSLGSTGCTQTPQYQVYVKIFQ